MEHLHRDNASLPCGRWACRHRAIGFARGDNAGSTHFPSMFTTRLPTGVPSSMRSILKAMSHTEVQLHSGEMRSRRRTSSTRLLLRSRDTQARASLERLRDDPDLKKELRKLLGRAKKT